MEGKKSYVVEITPEAEFYYLQLIEYLIPMACPPTGHYRFMLPIFYCPYHSPEIGLFSRAESHVIM